MQHCDFSSAFLAHTIQEKVTKAFFTILSGFGATG